MAALDLTTLLTQVRERIAAAPPDTLAATAGQLEELRVRCWERAVGSGTNGPGAPTDDGGPMLSAEEVAARLRLTRQRVYEMCRRGDLPGVRCGKYWRMRPADLERWLAARTPPA